MNETLDLQIKRLEFCRDCIVLDYDAGREEYNHLERMIEELKQLKSKQTSAKGRPIIWHKVPAISQYCE